MPGALKILAGGSSYAKYENARSVDLLSPLGRGMRMAEYRDSYDDEDEDAIDESELPDASDMDDDEFPDYVPCPFCGEQIYEGAEVCPECGSYISEETLPPQRPAWAVTVVIVGLVVFGIGWILKLIFGLPW